MTIFIFVYDFIVMYIAYLWTYAWIQFLGTMSFDLNRNKNTKLNNFGHGKDTLSQFSKVTWKNKLPIIEELLSFRVKPCIIQG